MTWISLIEKLLGLSLGLLAAVFFGAVLAAVTLALDLGRIATYGCGFMMMTLACALFFLSMG